MNIGKTNIFAITATSLAFLIGGCAAESTNTDDDAESNENSAASSDTKSSSDTKESKTDSTKRGDSKEGTKSDSDTDGAETSEKAFEKAGVDFKNFTYSRDDSVAVEATVKDGVYDNTDVGVTSDDYLFFEVDDVTYGTIDDRSLALVQVSYNTGGTGNFTDIHIFEADDKDATPLQILPGELVVTNFSISRGLAVFAQLDGPEITRTFLTFEDNGELNELDSQDFSYITTDSKVSELKFAEGTSSALVSRANKSEIGFSAREDQNLNIDIISPESGTTKVTVFDSKGKELGSASHGTGSYLDNDDWNIAEEIPADGTYTVRVTNSDDNSGLFIIAII